MRILFFLILIFFFTKAFSQCCSGGSGNFLGSQSSVGVLNKNQIEINANFQQLNSNKFLSGDSLTQNYLENYNSKQVYSKIGYGISEKFSISVESNYFINKTQIELDFRDTISSSGISDLIIFPKYSAYNRNSEKSKSEITLGIGYKIPIGVYNDSLVYFTHPVTKVDYYLKKPPAIQPTNGSNDIFFYTYLYHGFKKSEIRLISSILYIKKGWNPDGEKFGDYASASLIIAKTFFNKLDINLQTRYEWLDKMKRNQDLPFPNYDPESSGGQKYFIVPQISVPIYKDNFYVYGIYELPVYQLLNGTQIASQHSFTLGLSYRFFTKKCE